MQILDLPAGQLLGLTSARVRRVQVLYGRIWLTESGRSEDVFASSGDVIDLSRHGRTLVEGFGFARIAVEARPRRAVPWPMWLDTAVTQVLLAARRLRASVRPALPPVRPATASLE